MSKSDFKPIYERTLSEQAAWLKPVVDKLKQDNLANGSFNSYPDQDGASKDQFIRVYADRKEIVKVDPKTGNAEILKTFK